MGTCYSVIGTWWKMTPTMGYVMFSLPALVGFLSSQVGIVD